MSNFPPLTSKHIAPPLGISIRKSTSRRRPDCKLWRLGRIDHSATHLSAAGSSRSSSKIRRSDDGASDGMLSGIIVAIFSHSLRTGQPQTAAPGSRPRMPPGACIAELIIPGIRCCIMRPQERDSGRDGRSYAAAGACFPASSWPQGQPADESLEHAFPIRPLPDVRGREKQLY